MIEVIEEQSEIIKRQAETIERLSALLMQHEAADIIVKRKEWSDTNESS